MYKQSVFNIWLQNRANAPSTLLSNVFQPRVSDNILLLLNKPIGISSCQAVERVKRHLQVTKAGHAGTLDPLAEGLLIVGCAKATRALPEITKQPKRYQVTVRLGIRTATGDSEGEIVERRRFTRPDKDILQRLADAFTGDIVQTPPMYSALKHQGQRLYKLARANRFVPRVQRKVHINAIALGIITDNGFQFNVQCSKGTYIRTLVEDMGAWLGTAAYTAALKRTAIGTFRLTDAIDLDKLDNNARLAKARLTVDQVYRDYPAWIINDEAERRFKHGQALNDALPPQGTFRLYNHSGEFLGISEACHVRTRFI